MSNNNSYHMDSLDESILRPYGGLNRNCLTHTLQLNDDDTDENNHIQLIKHSPYLI